MTGSTGANENALQSENRAQTSGTLKFVVPAFENASSTMFANKAVPLRKSDSNPRRKSKPISTPQKASTSGINAMALDFADLIPSTITFTSPGPSHESSFNPQSEDLIDLQPQDTRAKKPKKPLQASLAKQPITAQPTRIQAMESTVNELASYIKALKVDHKAGQHDTFGSAEELRTTPLFSWSVKNWAAGSSMSTPGSSSQTASSTADSKSSTPKSGERASSKEQINAIGGSQVARNSPFAQYSLLGQQLEDYEGTTVKRAEDSLVFLNTNAPWSAFICGSQGSGKSYTLSCILESCLCSKGNIGRLNNPLAGIVFSYDPHGFDSVCEAAYLASHVPVTVLVSPSNFWEMQRLYSAIPTANKIKVVPLLLQDRHLNTQRMLRLMAFSEQEGSVPLYVEIIMKILKEMAIASQGTTRFSYEIFKRKLMTEELTPAQKGPMNLRLNLLESFMDYKYNRSQFGDSRATKDIFDSEPGSLTIVDLTDPFVDPASACVLFDICLTLFLGTAKESKNIGKIVALDEAHKFMNDSNAATTFTDNLLTVVREQRHKGARVVIATQEPTISPRLLDLCSFTIVHRFTSPDWLSTLSAHLAAASSAAGSSKDDLQKIFAKIVNLDVGESLLFSPSAMLDVADDKVKKLGMAYLKFKTRPRLTTDGGRSIMAMR